MGYFTMESPLHMHNNQLKVKYRIGYISAKNYPIATKRKANTSTEL